MSSTQGQNRNASAVGLACVSFCFALFLVCSRPGEFPISRLRSMAQSFQHRYPKIRDPLNKVYIKTLNVRGEEPEDRHVLQRRRFWIFFFPECSPFFCFHRCRLFPRPHLQTPDELSKVLHYSLRPSLEKGDVKLVVLDSIAAMFRAEHSGQEQDFTKR